MINVSEIKYSAPEQFESRLQESVYETFRKLNISFERVDTPPAITMEDCEAIDRRLDMQTVKTIFLCNRQQTDFYLFVTRGDKPFSTKDFSHALGISRVSFAPARLLYDMLGTHVGAATLLSMLADRDGRVGVVIDREVTTDEWYGCSDGTTTSYLKLRTADVLGPFLNYTGHHARIIEV